MVKNVRRVLEKLFAFGRSGVLGGCAFLERDQRDCDQNKDPAGRTEYDQVELKRLSACQIV